MPFCARMLAAPTPDLCYEGIITCCEDDDNNYSPFQNSRRPKSACRQHHKLWSICYLRFQLDNRIAATGVSIVLYSHCAFISVVIKPYVSRVITITMEAVYYSLEDNTNNTLAVEHFQVCVHSFVVDIVMRCIGSPSWSLVDIPSPQTR